MFLLGRRHGKKRQIGRHVLALPLQQTVQQQFLSQAARPLRMRVHEPRELLLLGVGERAVEREIE